MAEVQHFPSISSPNSSRPGYCWTKRVHANRHCFQGSANCQTMGLRQLTHGGCTHAHTCSINMIAKKFWSHKTHTQRRHKTPCLSLLFLHPPLKHTRSPSPSQSCYYAQIREIRMMTAYVCTSASPFFMHLSIHLSLFLSLISDSDGRADVDP